MPRAGFLRRLTRRLASSASAPRPTFRPGIEGFGLEDRLAPATFTVTNVNNTGAGSLRQAILDSNSTAGADTVAFAIGSGERTINVRQALPTITDTLTIDATTQPGFTQFPLIAINGSLAKAAGTAGLTLGGGSDNSVITGLVIRNFTGNGITILSSDNTVQRNYIGTDLGGNFASANRGSGVAVLGAASNNLIGGTTDGAGNLISGNGQYGVLLAGAGVNGNQVFGNAIGLDQSVTVFLPNRLDGVAVINGANGNTIGNIAGLNSIQGNRRHGVLISGFGSDNNVVTNNTLAFNTASGVVVAGGAVNTTIGDGNVISGNRQYGVVISGAGTTGTEVRGNSIGTDFAGNVAFGNRFDGVLINGGATGNTIGGTAAADLNIISANGRSGVNISGSGTSQNTVLGNRIGTDVTGGVALGNAGSGVTIGAGAALNTIGGTTLPERNVISGNRTHGVSLAGTGVFGNAILGNFIGTNAVGTSALGNRLDGISVAAGAANNAIGGDAAGEGNVISGNRRNGITLGGATGNVVAGNTIGLGAAGLVGLANVGSGVQVGTGTAGTLIGGTAAGAGNVISANTGYGVILFGATGVAVQGNFIGTRDDGTGVFGNGLSGVFATNRAAGNLIGGTAAGAGNTIANNLGDGVRIGAQPSRFRVSAGAGNSVLGNSIFSNSGLGINLAPSGTPRPNNNQPAPIINSATITGATITVNVTINGAPNSTFRIELFASNPGDGEGRTFLGFVTLTTNAVGTATGSVTLPYSATFGTSITGTATNLTNGDTSEFSAAVTAV